VSTFRASAHIEDGTLHTSRPLTAPEEVRDVIDSILYAMANGDGTVTAVDLTIESSDESHTPIGDSIAATSSAPLPVVDDEPTDGTDSTAAVPLVTR
jgi:hypothetical protein